MLYAVICYNSEAAVGAWTAWGAREDVADAFPIGPAEEPSLAHRE